MPTQSYILEGLCCPNCAHKIEKYAAGLDDVQSAVLDFANQRLAVELCGGVDAAQITAQITVFVHDIEPDVVVREGSAGLRKNAVREAQSSKKRALSRICFALGSLLFVAGLLFAFRPELELVLFLAAYLLVGGEVLWHALRNIARGELFGENFLMGVATIGAFAIGEYPEGVAVMLFYQIGEAFQSFAVGRSRKSIASLMDLRPDFANIRTDDGMRRVSPEEVAVGALLIVRPGERIPLDGVVAEGFSALDVSALTGESLPRDVDEGSEVLSGSVNQSGLLTIRVTKPFGESTVSKILELVQNAGSKKAQAENFITKFARIYTPIVVFVALALAVLPPLFLPNESFVDWLRRALVFLVVSCPCALVISIPLGFFGGIGGASRKGILIKGGNYLDALNHVDTVVFDKTGTLTKGEFRVTEIVPVHCTEGELLRWAALAESHSSHPIAQSIRNAYKEPLGTEEITSYEEISGQGVRVQAAGREVLLGNDKLLRSLGISYPETESVGTVAYLALDGVFAGHIAISDTLKEGSQQAICGLREMGVRTIAMLSGDRRAVGESIGRALGLDEVYTELLPHQKVEMLEELDRRKSAKGKLLFVGDGVNDAPALARADVGVAMGGVGSDAAIEAADVVLMTDEPSKIVCAIRVARKTRRIVYQNIAFAFAVKAVVLILGAFGMATMWEAVFADVGVALLAVLNAARAIRLR